MKWEKRGLIFCPDGTDELMKSHAAIPFADPINERVTRIYFSSRNFKGHSIPYFMDVDSRDLTRILNVSKPLLPLGELGTFDECGIMPCWVVNYEKQKYLYYIAWNPQVTVSYRLSIGLAISDDEGKTYRKYSNGPICDRGLDEPFFNTAPCVLYEDGMWRMWYISCTGWVMINNYPEPKYHVKYAYSEDGIHWTKPGIICIDYDMESEAIGRPSVIVHNGVYFMFFSYRKIDGYRTNVLNGYRIGLATSVDGFNWVKVNEAVGIGPSNSDWDSNMIEYCHVLKSNDQFMMLYNGNGFGASGIGYAVCQDISV